MQIDNYTPHNYVDKYSIQISVSKPMKSEDLMSKLFSKFPWWIEWLMKLRTILVKPLGLKGGGFKEHLHNMVQEKSDEEIIFGGDDKHLAFYVSIWCSELIDNKQTVSIVTIVRYNNRFGRVYFFFIKPFHKLIVKSLLKNIK